MLKFDNLSRPSALVWLSVAMPLFLLAQVPPSEAREIRPSILERLEKLEQKMGKEDTNKPELPPELIDRLQRLEKKLEREGVKKPEPPPLDDIKERLERVEKMQDTPNIWKRLRLQVSGFVDVAYTHNFGNPSSGLNQLHIFDTNANAFMPHLAQVWLERPAEAGSLSDRAGFRVRLNYGLDARVTRARTNFLNGTSNDELDVQEMYAQYILPIGKGLDIKVGKMNTLIGYEVISSWENPNFSRSFMFGLGQAFTTTGIRASYQFNPVVAATVGVVNGWDNVDDNNRGKTIEWLLALTPSPNYTASFYGSWGPEQGNRSFGDTISTPASGGFPGNSSAKRLAMGAIFTVKPTDMTTLVLEPYYANEASNPAVGANPALRTNARWNGLAAYVIQDFNTNWSFRLRGEIFEDASGSRTCGGTFNTAGGVNTCFGASQVTSATPIAHTMWEVTPTLQYRPIPSIVTRLEYRYDKSDRNVFQNGDRAVNHQQTASFQVIYLF